MLEKFQSVKILLLIFRENSFFFDFGFKEQT